MVCGFLGTVIGLERAVGLGERWTYAAPVLVGLGGGALCTGVLGRYPQVLILLGSGIFTLVGGRVVMLQRAMHTILMALAGAAWVVGNALWLGDRSPSVVAPWWMAFLGITIVGERLELTRYLRPVPWSRPLLCGVLALWGVGLIWSLLLRVGGDLLEWHEGRRWGGILNGVAVAIFLLNTVTSMVAARFKRAAAPVKSATVHPQ